MEEPGKEEKEVRLPHLLLFLYLLLKPPPVPDDTLAPAQGPQVLWVECGEEDMKSVGDKALELLGLPRKEQE